MTQLTDLELRHNMRHCSTDLARSLFVDLERVDSSEVPRRWVSQGARSCLICG